jgi:hypothetical protein
MSLSKKIILNVLKELDHIVPEKVNLLIGGGAALICQDIPITATKDIDAIPFKSRLNINDLSPYILKISEKFNLPKDLINDYFYTFSYSLPDDYGNRLIEIYKGKKIAAYAISCIDLLIMKFMAHRDKDREHIVTIIKLTKPDLSFVEKHLIMLDEKGLKDATIALEFFDEIISVLGEK